MKVRSDQSVVAEAVSLTGWPKLLPAGAPIEITGDVAARGRVGQPLTFTLNGPTRVVITGPKVQLPPVAGGRTVTFTAELILEPAAAGQKIELTVLRDVE